MIAGGNTTIASILLLGTAAFLSSCSSSEEREQRERPDMLEVGEALNCPTDRTPICIERIGRPYSCYCMDEDALKKILEPDKY